MLVLALMRDSEKSSRYNDVVFSIVLIIISFSISPNGLLSFRFKIRPHVFVFIQDLKKHCEKLFSGEFIG